MIPREMRSGVTVGAELQRLDTLRASVGRDGWRSNYIARGKVAYQGSWEKARRVFHAVRSAKDMCRVTLYNARDCPDWIETMWCACLGPTKDGYKVTARNNSVGATFEPPDPKAPAWGDVFIATGSRGSLRYDLQRGTILQRYKSLRLGLEVSS